jgi:predicted nucleic acid-binding protein
MILVDGNVIVNDAIRAPDNEPVVIISLGGSIRVATSQPVEAALIALKNSIFIESSVEIKGLLAARDLSLNSLPRVKRRSLSYNKALDVTDAESYFRGFRLFMKPRGVTFVR